VRLSRKDFHANLLRQLLADRNLSALIVDHQGAAKGGVAQDSDVIAGLDADLVEGTPNVPTAGN
jgi:hypothetical protein